MFFGLRMLTVPMAPCRFNTAARSAARLHVRGQRPGDRWRRAGEINDQFASNVQAREVIVIGLGNRQSVTGEHQLGLDSRGRIDPQADDRIGPEGQGLRSGFPDQREARVAFVDRRWISSAPAEDSRRCRPV